MSEDLAAKYGRKKVPQNDDNVKKDETLSEISKDENEEKYGINNTFTKKTQTDKEQMAKEKEIKSNIQDIVSKYSDEQQDLSTSEVHDEKTMPGQETKFVKFLKTIIVLCILLTIVCIIVSFVMKPQINIESTQIIEKIKIAEDLYYAKVNKYHYFSKTDYDHTLGIDLNKYKYFTAYEVVRDEKTGNYAVKVYGATNAFAITYCVIKSLIMNK